MKYDLLGFLNVRVQLFILMLTLLWLRILKTYSNVGNSVLI